MNLNFASVRPKSPYIAICLAATGLFTCAGLSLTYLFIRPQQPSHILTPQNAPLGIYVAQDSSASNRDLMGDETVSTGGLVNAADASRTVITVDRFDSDVEEIYSGSGITDEEYYASVGKKLLPVSNHDGTRIDLAVSSMLARVRSAGGRSALVIATDGWGEGMDAHAWSDLTAMAKELAASPKVVLVTMMGVRPVNVLKLRRVLAPLAAKLEFVDAGKLDASRVVDLLERGEK